ncbi:HNH endonuclease [Lysinibacillus fusiformis]|nr:HNH endonuclease [Lysinibacillus fusiformis]
MQQYKTKQEKSTFYKSSAWQKLRLKALERDNHECIWCAEEGRVTTKHDAVLEVDHINEIEYHPELALDLDNLRTLCKACHNKRHNRFDGKEKKWDDEMW